jgi:EAL domain-containing protein (putative c-di-GMP-specific phosphodiesterase class I)/DNA-binding NarL/FixJ family response regulator
MMTKRHIRVLVAEDDPAVRAALVGLIQAEPNFELVGETASAADAIDLAGQEQPDVAVIDVRMPGGGPAAVRGIKRKSPETRMLAFSAAEDRATVLEMLEAGVVGYLVKGSSIESIIESVEQAAGGQGSLSVEITGDVIEELVGQLSVRRRAEGRRRQRESRVRRAMESEGALGVVFQPICDLNTGKPVGVEALARFHVPPERGPDSWFAEASEVGLRRELELVALRHALSHLSELPKGLFLSVNISPATLRSAPFRKAIAAVDAKRIVLEVTEHTPVQDYDALNNAVERVRAVGARLAIDDAGAGFASLRHILRLAPDFVKLDRTLIDNIERDRSHQALAAGLISFARKIDATIVAEGIERAGQLRALRDLGVSCGQGFLLARPAPLPLAQVAHGKRFGRPGASLRTATTRVVR